MPPRPRRLCMVVHGPYPVGEPRVAREARAAIGAGFEVDVVAMRQGDEPRLEEVDGARVHRLSHLRSSRSGPVSLVHEYVGFALLAAGTVSRLHRRDAYGVVHVHNPPDFLVLSALLPRLTGARAVLDIHDLAPDLFAARLGERTGARQVVAALRQVERVATRFADAVVTVHEPYRAELVARGVPAEKVVVVLNTLDDRLLPAPAPRPADEGFRVVYHGSVTPHYGVEIVVEAFARLAEIRTDARLEIYGGGDAVPAVRERAHTAGVADRVAVEGRMLPHDEVLRRVAGASVGVVAMLPIARNLSALPTKLLEYVALEVPVVAVDVPAIRSSFDERELFFYEGGSAESLAAALATVAGDPAAARARTAAAHERFRRDYAWSAYAARYVELLEQLLV